MFVENDAISAVCILYIITFVPYLHSAGLMQQLPYKTRFLLCLLPNTAFAYSNRLIIRLESLGKLHLIIKWRVIYNVVDRWMTRNYVFYDFNIKILNDFICFLSCSI